MVSRKLTRYWTGKTVLITGASSGIGYALVEALAPYRVHFCLLSRRTKPIEELTDRLSTSPSQFWIRSCDVQKRSEVESAIADFVDAVGHLDVAWVNSGIAAGDASFHRWNWDLVERTIDTNLKGAIYTAHTCLRFMVAQNEGTIVAISSAAAMRGLPSSAIYSATKIGLAYFMEAMAVELPQIQFTTIYPGFVATSITRNASRSRLWLMPAGKAAQLMIRAVASRKCEYIYPFRMNLMFRLTRLLPAPWYRWLGHKIFLRLSKESPS